MEKVERIPMPSVSIPEESKSDTETSEEDKLDEKEKVQNARQKKLKKKISTKEKAMQKSEQNKLMNVAQKMNKKKRGRFRGAMPVDPSRAMAVSYGNHDIKDFAKRKKKKLRPKGQKATFSAFYSQGLHETRLGNKIDGVMELSKVSI